MAKRRRRRRRSRPADRPLGGPMSLRIEPTPPDEEVPMRVLKEDPEEERVDFISAGPDGVILSYVGAEYRQWIRDGRPPMMQLTPAEVD